MHKLTLLAGLAVLLMVAGCGPGGTTSAAHPDAPPASTLPSRSPSASASAPVSPKDPWLDDGKPQAGLPRMKLFLGAKELNAELALTLAAIQKGMMWRTNVAETEGMLFVFGRPHETSFWMRNVPIDIDVAYIDTEGTIREIHRLERFNTNPVPARTDTIQYALETAEGWFARNGISTGAVIRTENGTLPDTFFRRGTAR